MVQEIFPSGATLFHQSNDSASGATLKAFMTRRRKALRILESSSKGFTLLEVLIAMAILGLMAAVVFAGLRLGTGASEKGEKEAQRLQHLRIVSEMIGVQLRCATPYSLIKRPKAGQAQDENFQDESERGKKGFPVFFEGMPDSLRFVTARALEPSMNGLVQAFYELERSGNEPNFRVREDFVRGIDSLKKAPDKNGSIVQKGVSSLQFHYFGKSQEEKEPRWRTEWNGRTMRGLPSGVRIQVVLADDTSYPLDWIVWIPSEPWSAGTGQRATLPFFRQLFK
jgi:prepilin-type N-terminal cleavage/methylation domain-containing protein